MNIIAKLLEKHKEKVQLRNEKCDDLIVRIDTALSEINAIFANTSEFIDPKEGTFWTNKHSILADEIKPQNIQSLKKATNYSDLQAVQRIFQSTKLNLTERISQHNNQVASARIKNAYQLIGNVEGRKLDEQQMTCIVKEAHNHLVIAGAGTGKTTTVVGKIKFLLRTKKYKPEEILVLSFTNASATEMCERIQKETGFNIAASTFHKLGLGIIKEVEGIVPKITQLNLKKYISEQLQFNMKNQAYLNILSNYLLYNRVVSKSEFEFKTKTEYEEYLKLNPPTTINNEIVKSYGEMDIANFLTQNGIAYVYEKPYLIDTRTSEYGQYCPDFYLPEYDIYIEYFGIDKSGQVPSYFKGKNGMSATETYQASMQWKRETHNANNTHMIECFAYEKFDGSLLEELKNKLQKNSVVLEPKTTNELWEQIVGEDNSILDGIVELFETLINLIKSNNYTISDVKKLNVENGNMQGNNSILTLIEPIFDSYCDYLKTNNEIDFNDMINIATEYVRTGKYINPYKYVIVDEYQDISKSRFMLLKTMRKSNDFELFCVGDDWQSIYRFAGSDIGFILNFKRYWGATEYSKIETTYRFTQKLIEISGDFVMQNPAQIQKTIQGKQDMKGFALGEINGYTDKYAIEFMVKRLDDLPNAATVFFIGRYSFDLKLLSDSGLLDCQYNNVSGRVDVKYRKRSDLRMEFITAHKSKGLQADYVFIINNKKSRMGFPSKVQDAAILNLLLDNCDQYPFAEERRLFYVAMTRSKVKSFVVTVSGQESKFVMELRERYGEEMKREQFECPICGGRLLRKSGPYGDFLGCSNYKTAGCNYKRKINRQERIE